MARRKIDVTIGAKDNASAVFKKVGASTVALGVALGNLAGKMISGVFSWLKAGVADALENEQANYLLAQALKRAGDASGEFTKSLGDQINALQGVTGASNTYLTQMATQLSTLGVQNNELGSTIRLLHALEGANISGESAMRAVTRAMQGDYSALSRYIPALRTATTEVEKWDIINQTAERGLQTQIDNLSTLTGAWKALKTHLGSVKDDIWEVISRGLGLGEMFGNLADAIDTFRNSEGFKKFLEQLERGATLVKGMTTALAGGDIKIGESFKFIGEYLLAVFKDGANLIGEAIATAIGKQWWASSSNTQKMEKLQAKLAAAQERAQLEPRHAPVAAGPMSVHRMGSGLVDSRQEVARLQSEITALERKMAAGGTNVAAVLDKYDSLIATVKEVAETAVTPTASRVRKADEAVAKLRQDSVQREKEALDRELAAARDAAERDRLRRQHEQAVIDAEEAIKKARAAEAMAAERVQKAAERRANAEEQLAGMAQAAVGDIIQQIRDEARQRKDANKRADEWQKNREKAEKIRERLRLGGRATAHERRLLEADDRRKAAFKEAEDARLAEDLAKFDQEAAKQRLEQAQKARDKVQEDMKGLLETIKDNLNQALTAE